MGHKFQTARQARMGRNMVKSSSPDFLITGYVQDVRIGYIVKCVTTTRFFIAHAAL
jgi:hypothetical protein